MPQSFLYDIPPIHLFKTNQAHKSGFSVVIILSLLKMKIPKVRHC